MHAYGVATCNLYLFIFCLQHTACSPCLAYTYTSLCALAACTLPDLVLHLLHFPSVMHCSSYIAAIDLRSGSFCGRPWSTPRSIPPCLHSRIEQYSCSYKSPALRHRMSPEAGDEEEARRPNMQGHEKQKQARKRDKVRPLNGSVWD